MRDARGVVRLMDVGVAKAVRLAGHRRVHERGGPPPGLERAAEPKVSNRIEQRQPALARRLSSWPDKLQEVPIPAPFMISRHPSDQRFRGAGAIHDFEMPDA
jgi:hypothetical protein